MTACLVLFGILFASAAGSLFASVLGNSNGCQPPEFPCGNSSVCLNRLQHCDGHEDCRDGEDEKDCDDSFGSLGVLMSNLTWSLDIQTTCSDEDAPAMCHCTRAWWISCAGKNLTEPPSDLTVEVTNLSLDQNFISVLTEGMFSSFPNLTSLSLKGNRIASIPDGVFTSLSKLGKLYLSDNAIASIGPRTFYKLPNLKWLILKNNEIKNFDTIVLGGVPRLELLDLTGNQLTLQDSVFPSHDYLTWIELTNNQIEKVRRNLFQNLRNTLGVLYLRDNLISEIEGGSFRGFKMLRELDLAANRIYPTFPNSIFNGLQSLAKLNLSYNPITMLSPNLFRNLYNLKSLDLRGIEILNIDVHHFQPLVNLEFIYFKKFLYCNYAPAVRNCEPRTDGLSSTEHLLVYPVLRLAVWAMAFATCTGNSLVLLWRHVSTKEDHVLSLFIKNLAVADLLMGVYLAAIGAQDLAFRNRYNRHALSWTSSWECTLCGVVAMVSCEVSVLIISLITVERYRCIKTNIRVVTVSRARYLLVSVWLIGLFLALFPVVWWPHAPRRFYASNGLCFPLHIAEPFMLGWEYSSFVFLGLNFLAMLLIISLYFRMFVMIREDRKRARPFLMQKNEDAVLAFRFFFIVLTDCMCWIPIVLIKMMALSEIIISDNLYAFVVIFVLPINSALNPVIYTMAAPSEMRKRLKERLRKIYRRFSNNVLMLTLREILRLEGSKNAKRSSTSSTNTGVLISSTMDV